MMTYRFGLGDKDYLEELLNRMCYVFLRSYGQGFVHKICVPWFGNLGMTHKVFCYYSPKASGWDTTGCQAVKQSPRAIFGV